jgi:hypothetical protein
MGLLFIIEEAEVSCRKRREKRRKMNEMEKVKIKTFFFQKPILSKTA